MFTSIAFYPSRACWMENTQPLPLDTIPQAVWLL
jgi:hypothetical protein